MVLYTSIGGMEMVGRTNLIHTIFLYIGMTVALLLKLKELGGISGLQTALPESFFSMGTIGYPKIGSWLIASVLGACTAQAGLQPILCAENEKTARRASIAIAFIVAPFGVLTALLGMIAKVYYPNLSNAKTALPTLLMDLPTIISVIVIVAVFSAIFSTAAPIILSCGTILEKDVFPYFSIEYSVSDGARLNRSKVVTAICGMTCVLLSIGFLYNSRILDIVYFAYAIRGSLFVILMFGIYWKNYEECSAVVAMIITSTLSIIWIMYKHFKGAYPINPDITEVYVAIFSTIVVSLLMSIIFGRSKHE